MVILDFDPARRTNGRAIADLATLGLLHPDDHVLDVTAGNELGFWNEWLPARLTTNDLDPNADTQYHWDARSLPVDDGTFDVVVFDPPYANRGTSRLPMDPRYGLGEYRTRAAVEQLLIDGTVEALRASRRLVLVKCQDASVASQYRPQTYLVWDAARTVNARLVAELHVVGRREQPTGKKQLNVWSAASTLLAFKVASRPGTVAS